MYIKCRTISTLGKGATKTITTMAYKPEEIATMLINAIPNDTPKSEVASGAALFVADLIAQFGFDHTIHSAIKNMIDCYVGAIKEGSIKHT